MTTIKKTVGRPVKAKRTARPKRVPLSGGQKRMHVEDEDKDSNFHYAWINDSKDLIARAKRAGFIPVTVAEMPMWGSLDVDSADASASIVSMPVGNETTAFLMKQPMEYYEEDEQARADRLLKKESGMKQQLNSGQDGTYGEVKFS